MYMIKDKQLLLIPSIRVTGEKKKKKKLDNFILEEFGDNMYHI